MNKFTRFLALLLTLLLSSAGFSQGKIQMDAIGFLRDSGKTQVEIYYSIPQGVLSYEEKNGGWMISIDARAELWENGTVLASRSIKKEKFMKGSKADLDNSKGNLILEGAALEAPLKGTAQAALIFFFTNDKGKVVADTFKRSVIFAQALPGKYSLGGVELASGLVPTTDHSNPFEKVGYIVTPNPSAVYGPNDTALSYYSELYVPSSMISSSAECNIVTTIFDGVKHQMSSTSHRQSLGSSVIPLLGTMGIDGLPSDSYILRLEVKQGTTLLAATEKQFYYDNGMSISEENPSSTASTQALDEESIFAISGIANMPQMEIEEKGDQAMYLGTVEQQKDWKRMKETADTISDQNEKEKMVAAERKFLFGFWRKKDREKGSSVPLTTFKEYYRQVGEANRKFTYQKAIGWKTDFGRIFLIYGPPDERNIIRELHQVDTKPIIIWQYVGLNVRLLSTERSPYERLNTQVNYNYPTFVFVDKLGGGKFVLVHSNVQGETYEQDWYMQEALRTSH